MKQKRVVSCSDRCHVPAGGRSGEEAAAPHPGRAGEQLQEVTAPPALRFGTCSQGESPDPRAGRGKEAAATKTTDKSYETVQHLGGRVLSWCVCCWACLVLMFGTEKNLVVLVQDGQNLIYFLLDIPTQRKNILKKREMGR